MSSEYFGVLGIPLLHGRAFEPSERTERAGVAMVSDTTARELWPGESPLGQTLKLEGEPARSFTVVGIVADVPGSRFGDWPRAGIYLPTGPESAGTELTVRVHGDPDQVRLALFDRLTAIDPALDDITTLRAVAKIEIYLLGLAFWIAVVLAGLALVFTLSGLFSVLSFVVEQRRKEIGVRMALGATAGQVTRIVLSRLFKLVGAGLVTGSVMAALLTTLLLSTPLASLVSGGVQVFDPIAYAGSALCIVVACLLAALVPARRAARIDPMTTLREE